MWLSGIKNILFVISDELEAKGPRISTMGEFASQSTRLHDSS